MSAGVVRDGLKHIGGVWWKCVECGTSVRAECECCQPPQCPAAHGRDFAMPCKRCLTVGRRLGPSGVCADCVTATVELAIKASKRYTLKAAESEAWENVMNTAKSARKGTV